MRGNFYTSALTTLDLFTDPLIHSMTVDTDFDPEATATRKRATESYSSERAFWGIWKIYIAKIQAASAVI